MSDYARMEAGDGACGLMRLLDGWFAPDTATPYVRARRELRETYGQLMHDVRANDAKFVALYASFYAHVGTGRAPVAEHFNGAVAWYKQNRDEIHAVITELLNLYAAAADDPAAFVYAWSAMPEKIRQSRRRWEQRYTPENIAERNVTTAFTMPRPRGRLMALDDATDVEDL